MNPNSIFISYRRSDSEGISQRICDWLKLHFGKDAVFIDIDNIPSGANFPAVISRALQQSAVVLVIVGKNWTEVRDDKGLRRLDNPNDWVRQEVREALNRKEDILLIPLLVEQAEMPKASELPEELRDLININGRRVRSIGREFRIDVNSLMEDIDQHFEELTLKLPDTTFKPQDSDVAIVATHENAPEKLLILIDHRVAEAWNQSAREIHVYGDRTLADANKDRIDSYRDIWRDVDFVVPSDLLLRELNFISGTGDGLPGGLMLSIEQPLVFENTPFGQEPITPLLPINPVLLKYFTPEDLVQRMKLRPVDNEQLQVEISLDLPLSGANRSGAYSPDFGRGSHLTSAAKSHSTSAG